MHQSYHTTYAPAGIMDKALEAKQQVAEEAFLASQGSFYPESMMKKQKNTVEQQEEEEDDDDYGALETGHDLRESGFRCSGKERVVHGWEETLEDRVLLDLPQGLPHSYLIQLKLHSPPCTPKSEKRPKSLWDQLKR